jgi:hypothetical protein
MSERRPIFSVKHAGQKIGHIEGDQAFDLFARPCARYDQATGLLRNLSSQLIVGYVSLKGSFVGSSFLAEELFPAPLQNGGEPSLDTFLSSERVLSDDGSPQSELQVQSEAEDLTRNSLKEERASTDQPALQDEHETLPQHSLRSLNKPDDKRPLDESSFQGERECPSWAVEQALDEPSLQIKPEDLTRPSLQENHVLSDQPVLSDAPESPGQHSLRGEHELLNKLGVDDERSMDESSLQGDGQPRSKSSLQGKPEPLPAPLEGVASVALSDSREDDRERSSCAVDPKDSSQLRGVDLFMVHLAGYLRSHDAAEAACELSNHDESKPHDAQSASIQKESLSARLGETNSVNDEESIQTELSSDDNVAEALANLQGAAPIVPSPAPSTPDTCHPPSVLETDARTDESSSRSDRYEYGPQSAADEDRLATDIQPGQIASDLNPLTVELDSALDAVKSELKNAEPTVARQGSDLTKDSLVSAEKTPSLRSLVTKLRRVNFRARSKRGPNLALENKWKMPPE